MGKRKHSSHDESDYRSIRKKLKKLERKLEQYKIPSNSSSSDSDHSCRGSTSNHQIYDDDEYNVEYPTAVQGKPLLFIMIN